MQPAPSCPRRDDYERLIHGELAPGDAERLRQHLEGCSSCAAVVRTLREEDTLLSAVPGASVDAPTGEAVSADLTRPLALSAPSLTGTAELTSLLAPARGPDEIGRLAHYRVLKVLGEGGMGVVFLAEDTRLSRTVALKTMRPETAADPRHRQRFLREARAAAKVESDHIVPIYDVGEERGGPWLAMPLLKGQSLDELLKRVKVLKPAQAARLGAQMAKGLAAAHAAGLIHRDVKPANVWVEPEGGGRAKLLDFGLARDQSPPPEHGPEHLTRPGAVVGTPAFMAPEQARGGPLDARADLFSLGCVLYRAVTGRLPFQGHGMMDTLVALATETPPAPHRLNPDVPRPLSALIMSLLAKDRSGRPASAAAVAAALQALQETSTSTLPVAQPAALPVAPPAERNPWADLTAVTERPAPAPVPQRRWWSVTAAVLALGGALATGIVVIIKHKDGKEVARVTVPDGGSAQIKQDGDRGKSKVAPVDMSPDRRAAEWVLSVRGEVTIRVADKVQVVTAARELPAGPFQLTKIGIWDNPKVADEEMVNLKGLTNLTSLGLGQTRVGDAGLDHLKELTTLTILYLRGIQEVSDAGLVHLKALTNLTYLDLSFTKVSDAGLVHLKELPQLTTIVLWGCPRVTGTGLEHFQGLRTINLDATPTSDTGLEHLKALTSLTDLELDGTRVSDAGLVHLKGLTKLTQLELDGTRVSDAGLIHLKGLTHLGVLYLCGTRVSDAGLVHLKGLTKLGSLHLSGTRVSDAGLRDLANLPLTRIRLDNSRVSARGFASFRSAFPAAEVIGEPRPSLVEDLLAAGATLIVRSAEGQEDRRLKKLADLPREPFLVRRADCTGLNKPLVELLARLSEWREYEFERLEALDLTGCAIDNLGFAPPLEGLQELNVSGTRVADLQPLLGLKRLRQLSLAGTPVADAALQALENLPDLRQLDLNRTGVTGRGLGSLAKLPKLAELSLAGSKVSDLFAAEVGALTKLERLSLAGCTFSDAGLKHLTGLSHLTQLDLTGTQVTADGVAGLQKALPTCKVLYGPAVK